MTYTEVEELRAAVAKLQATRDALLADVLLLEVELEGLRQQHDSTDQGR